jgi:hypothetical protein
MLAGLITISGGLIAAAALITKLVPNSNQLLDKLTPYTGWIGIVMFGWGVKEVLFSVLGIGMLSTFPLSWTFWLLTGLADLGVGFLLGFGLITQYALGKNEQALARGQQIRAKLVPYQAGLGIFAIVMGIAYIVL